MEEKYFFTLAFCSIALRFKGGTPGSRGGWGVDYRDPPPPQLYNIFLVKKFLFKKIYYLSSALYFDYLMQKALDQ